MHWRFLLAAAMSVNCGFAADAQVKSATGLPGPKLADPFQARILTDIPAAFEQGEYINSIGALGEILESTDDVIVRDADDPRLYRSLSSIAESLLTIAPKRAREQYEIQFGGRAASLLKIALKEADSKKIDAVQRRYLYTRAGSAAAFYCLLRAADRQNWSVVSHYLQRLSKHGMLSQKRKIQLLLWKAVLQSRTGDTESAEATLKTFLRSEAARSSQVSKSKDDSSRTENLRAWVLNPRSESKYTHFYVNRAHSVASATPWSVGKQLASIQNKTLTQIANTDRFLQKSWWLPQSRPVIEQGVLFVRLADGLVAVDLNSGVIKWRVPSAMPSLSILGVTDPNALTLQQQSQRLIRRLTEDSSFGTLIVDGDQLYVVEGVADDIGVDRKGLYTKPQGTGLPTRPPSARDIETNTRGNALSAYNTATGKLAWQIGTTLLKTTPGFENARFLGAPLIVDEKLFAVVDSPDGNNLVTLSAEGTVLRQSTLGFREEFVPSNLNTFEVARRPRPPVRVAPPIATESAIICPTSSGEFVAIDPLSGNTKWVVTGADNSDESRVSGQIKIAISQWVTSRWSTSEAISVGNIIVLSSANESGLKAVDLDTGVQLWSSPKTTGLFVTAISDREILVVDSHRLIAMRAGTGEIIWSIDSYPNNASPSGRGVLVGDTYFLPLTNGTIVGLDTRVGKYSGSVVGDTAPVGNLIGFGTKVISTNGFSVRELETVVEATTRDPQRPITIDLARQFLALGDFKKTLTKLEAIPIDQRATTWKQLWCEAIAVGIRQAPAEAESLVAELSVARDVPIETLVNITDLLVEIDRKDLARKTLPLGTPKLASAFVPLSRRGKVRLNRRLSSLARSVGVEQGVRETDWETSFRNIRTPQTYSSRLVATGKNVKRDAKKLAEKNTRIDVALVGPDRPAIQLDYYQVGHVFVGRTLKGIKLFEVKLDPPNQYRGSYFNGRNEFLHAVAADGIVILHRGQDVIAVNYRAEKPVVAWKREVASNSSDLYALRLLWNQARKVADLQPQRFYSAEPQSLSTEPRRLVYAGGGICFWSERELICVEPGSGNLIWSRSGIEPTIDILTDQSKIIVTPIFGSQSTVIDAFEGKLLKSHSRQILSTRIATVAGKMLHWTKVENVKGAEVYLIDPYENKEIWSRKGPNNAFYCSADNWLVEILPSGKIHCIDVFNGEVLFEQKISLPADFKGANLVPFDGNRAILILKTKVSALYGSQLFGSLQFSGVVAGLDIEKGTIVWSRDVTGLRLRRDQLRELPVFIAANIYRKAIKQGNTTRLETPRARLECIDIRDGKVLESTSTVSRLGGEIFKSDFNANDNTLEIETNVRRLQLRVEAPK